MLLVSDIKDSYEKYNLPERFADCLPEVCDVCGSPLWIKESLTELQCSNPRCPDKIAMRISMICDDLNIKYFGDSTIRKFMDYYMVTNPMCIFALEKGMVVSDEISQEVSDKIINQIVEKRNFLLWEYVMYSNLPYLKTNAKKIFQGYNTLEDAYRDIESGGVDFIQQKLGIKCDGEVSVQAMKVYSTLMEYKPDLFESIVDVNIVNLGNVKEIDVVCSDEVGSGFKRKADFYDYVKENFGDKVHVNFLGSVKKSINYLVWKGADGSPARYTSKVRTVEGWNESGKTNIPIVSAEQFINIMREL